MIYPRHLKPLLQNTFQLYPIITLSGPRQSGKTTLCKAAFPDIPYTSLEDLDTRTFAKEDPKAFLKQYSQGCIIDEIQRVPELSSYLQTFVDEKKQNGLFVLTGSQNFRVRESLSQSLAGRTAVFELLPFSIDELPKEHQETNNQMIYSGFYPRIYEQNIPPERFYSDYIATYVERDLRQLSLVKDISSFQSFLKLCAGRIGQIINFEKLGSDVGVSQPTAKEWFTLLEASYIGFKLSPYHNNHRKRLVKSPKLYFYDVGLAAFLLGIETKDQLESHPLRGQLFENMIVVEAIKHQTNLGKRAQFYFYRDSDGNEIDLLWPVVDKFIAIEIKAGQTIGSDFFKNFSKFSKTTNLTLDNVVVYGGEEEQERSQAKITSAKKFSSMIEKIKST